MSAYSAPNWTTAPISPTCEHFTGVHIMCGEPTDIVYPAWGSGWMALCQQHGEKHLPHAFKVENAIAAGETWEGIDLSSITSPE